MFLVASLLTASPAACTCSQYEEPVGSENECHSRHEAEASVEASETATLGGESCICIIDHRTPCVATKSETKELKSKTQLYYLEQLSTTFEPSSVNIVKSSLPFVANDSSYSNTLRSLLPSRAPPRL